MMDIGVLFDYNGVLANDEHLHERAFAFVLDTYGAELTSPLYKKHCLGRTDRDGFLSLQHNVVALKDLSVDALVHAKQAAYQDYAAHEDIVYPGAVDVIKELSKRVLLGVVTSSMRVELVPVLTRYGLLGSFAVLVTADDIAHGKPDPEGYAKGLKGLGTKQANTLVIEDSVSGVRAAKAAGLKCIAVTQTTDAKQLAEADLVLDRIAAVNIAVIERLVAERP